MRLNRQQLRRLIETTIMQEKAGTEYLRHSNEVDNIIMSIGTVLSDAGESIFDDGGGRHSGKTLVIYSGIAPEPQNQAASERPLGDLSPVHMRALNAGMKEAEAKRNGAVNIRTAKVGKVVDFTFDFGPSGDGQTYQIALAAKGK